MYLLFVPAFVAFAIIFTIELEPIVASLFSTTESVAPEFIDSETLDVSPAGW